MHGHWLTPVRDKTLRERPGSRCPGPGQLPEAVGKGHHPTAGPAWSRTAIIACNGRPRAAGSTSALKLPGATNGKVGVLGGGVAGMHAAVIALGMRAEVTVIDLSLPTLRRLDTQFHGGVRTIASNTYNIAEAVEDADLVIGSVLIPGARAPKLVTNDLVAQMREGSVLVDIAVDQGGCFQDTHATTHDDPTFTVYGSVFSCVANMPGAVPRSSTFALTNATLPYLTALADQGWQAALRADPALAGGLTTHAGQLANLPVGQAHGIDAVEPAALLAWSFPSLRNGSTSKAWPKLTISVTVVPRMRSYRKSPVIRCSDTPIRRFRGDF